MFPMACSLIIPAITAVELLLALDRTSKHKLVNVSNHRVNLDI
jgi:hypothetical protein